MLKQSALYFIITVIVVLCARYLHLAIIYFDLMYTYFNVLLAPLFENTWLRHVLILFSLPLAVTAIPAIGYHLIKKKNMPYFLETTWIVWLIFTLSNLLIQ